MPYNIGPTRCVLALIAVASSVLLSVLVAAATGPVSSEDSPSVRTLDIGISGNISADPVVIDLTGDGVNEVLLGTSNGLYAISNGTLLYRIPSLSAIIDVAAIDDVNGDGIPDVAAAASDIYFPNIRLYDGASGQKLWHFIPSQEVFIQNRMWTQQQTLTYDVETADLNGDGVSDLLASSGYRVYGLEGRTGSELWDFQTVDNIWKVTSLSDLTGDGVPEVAAGGQNGYMHVIDGRDGSVIWEKRLVARYNVINEKGAVSSTVDRSIWDITPVEVAGIQSAIVSAEDGSVRLVNLRDGNVEWETKVVEYVTAMLYEYYGELNGRATSPGGFHFFNLRISLTPDTTGDDVPDTLASAYVGRAGYGRQEPRGAGLFLLDTASGQIVWENKTLDLKKVGGVEVVLLEDDPVVLVPLDQLKAVDLATGVIIQNMALPGRPGDTSMNRYRVTDLGDGNLLLASDIAGLFGLSLSTQSILWDFSRVAGVSVESDQFTGDATPDLLVSSKAAGKGEGGGGNGTRSRVIYVVDGATGERAWSYEMPLDEFSITGGIAGLIVVPDMDGDGRKDIAGYSQSIEAERRWDSSEEATVVVFSGEDGSSIFRQSVVEQTYYGDWGKIFQDPSAIEQVIRAQFEAEMEQQLPEELERWEQEFRNQFERELENRWSEEEQNLRREFEDEINRRMSEGLSEEEAGKLWDEFDQSLPGKREAFIENARTEFEEGLPEEQKRWMVEMQSGWEDQFLRDRLPQELEQWQNRLQDEEQNRRIQKLVMSLDVLRTDRAPGGVALLVTCPRDVFVLDASGNLLWTWTFEPWVYQDPFTGREEPDMEFGLKGSHGMTLRVPGDLNGDGTDDLIAFTGDEVVTGISTFTGDRLSYEPGPSIEVETGMDPRQGVLVDDMDGDGAKDFAYQMHRENQPPAGVFRSSGNGRELIRLDNFDQGSITFQTGTADFDGDGADDILLFQRWVQDREGPMFRVLSGRSGASIWEYGEYKEMYLFDQWGYTGEVQTAAPVKDLTGDGTPELAVLRGLTWQPGVEINVYDVTRDELVKQVVLEEIDPTRDEHQGKHWQPGIVIREMADFDGDGRGELVIVAAFGKTEREKQPRLMVVDLAQEAVIADFQMMGSEFVDLGTGTQFGMVGVSGEVYFLDATNDLQITSPSDSGSVQSPVTVQWTGVTPGAYNQVFVDGIEVAVTNENEVTITAAQGEHRLSVRSLDENGRGLYATSGFTVEKGGTGVMWVTLATVGMLGVVLYASMSRIARSYLGRRRNG